MEYLDNALSPIKPNIWMTPVDLKNASFLYQSILNIKNTLNLIGKVNTINFKSLLKNQLKPPSNTLRKQDYPSVVFVNDSYSQGNAKTECEENFQATIYLLKNLGFTINDERSVLTPTQVIEFWGFIL